MEKLNKKIRRVRTIWGKSSVRQHVRISRENMKFTKVVEQYFSREIFRFNKVIKKYSGQSTTWKILTNHR